LVTTQNAIAYFSQAIIQGAAVVAGRVPYERAVSYCTGAAPAPYRTAIGSSRIPDEHAIVYVESSYLTVAIDATPHGKSPVVANDAVADGRVSLFAANSAAPRIYARVTSNDAICNRRAAAIAAYPPTRASVTICDCKASKDRIAVFAVLKNEAAVAVAVFAQIAIAVNYRCSHYGGVLRKKALDGDGLAQEIYIPVTSTGIYAGEDIDKVAIVGIINCSLNVIEIGRAIVVDDEYLRLARNGQEQAKKQGTGYNPHFEILQVRSQLH
jgi:hypothetical protein